MREREYKILHDTSISPGFIHNAQKDCTPFIEQTTYVLMLNEYVLDSRHCPHHIPCAYQRD